MPGKKNPKETKRKLLEVAFNLFLKDGYENVSLQAIHEEVGVSKGALLHHFKSKEELAEACMVFQNELAAEEYKDFFSHNMAGREKITHLLQKNIENVLNSNDEKGKGDVRTNSMYRSVTSPQLLLLFMRHAEDGNIATLLTDLINEGNADGSLDVKFPEECGKLLLLLYNTWTTPFVFNGGLDLAEKKLKYMQYLFKLQGADIISDELVKNTLSVMQVMHDSPKQS